MPCTNPTYYGVSGMGSHGKIAVRQITRRRCGRDDFPTTLVVYTPDPGFVGVDNVTLYAGQWRTAVTVHVEEYHDDVAKHVAIGRTGSGQRGR